MPRRHHHHHSSSSSSSYDSAHSYGSQKSYRTDDTSYSEHRSVSKKVVGHSPLAAQQPTPSLTIETDPRSSVETYASTVDLTEPAQSSSTGPMPLERSQCYEPEASPAGSLEFAALFPSTRRLLIQHDDSTPDGNMNIHIDTEVTTARGRKKKVTLFHLRMKDLQDRQFSLRRYCRDSGREVASCKRHYIKSTPSTPLSDRSGSERSLTRALHGMSLHQQRARADSGYQSAESDDEDEKKMEETLNIMTAPSEDVVSRPTESIRLDFSNYAQVIVDRRKADHTKEYNFEYWGHDYTWKRSKHIDDGETIYSYDLIRDSSKQKVAIIMPDALSPQEAQWEAKQGGWIPASSMRLLRSDISDDLGDVIIATGLIALTDDSMRRHFRSLKRQR